MATISPPLAGNSSMFATFPARLAIDGDPTTSRWVCNSGEIDAHVHVDLGDMWTVTRVEITWGEHAANYAIEGSTDMASWSSIATGSSGSTNGVNDHTGLSAAGVRFLRVRATQAAYIGVNNLLIEGNLEDDYTIIHPTACTADSTYLGFSVASARDNDLATEWAAQLAPAVWLEADFGADTYFDEIIFTSGDANDDYGSAFNVEYSTDGSPSSFTNLVTRSGQPNGINHIPAGVTGRYFRINFTTTPSGFIRCQEVYGVQYPSGGGGEAPLVLGGGSRSRLSLLGVGR